MARIAGDKPYYTFVLKNEGTGRYHQDVAIKLYSVTTIIKATIAAPQLVPWAYKVTRDHISGLVGVLNEEGVGPEEILDMLSDEAMLAEYMKDNKLRPEDLRDAAAERGTTEHAFLEHLATLALLDEEHAMAAAYDAVDGITLVTGYGQAIAGWWIAKHPHVVESETVLYSLKHGYCGSVDLIWKDDEGTTILTDLKTGNENRKPYATDHIQVDGYADAYREMHGEQTIDRTSVLIAREDGTWQEEETTLPRGTFLSVLDVYSRLKEAR